MIIIGEKINGTRKSVAEAVARRDSFFVQNLARQQVEAGADWLDINAGTSPEQEPEALTWLVETVQAVTEIPLCLDSVNSHALKVAIEHTKHRPMINSISGEKGRLDNISPIVSHYKCPLIMLAMDDDGIPKTTDSRMAIIRRLVEETRRIDVDDELVYVDPLVMALSVNTESGLVALDTIRLIRAEFPKVHIVSGLSNISFGLPLRPLINQVFMTLAIEAGMDSAILDPLDKRLSAMMLATGLVLGKDRFCLAYNRAYRAGRLD